MKTSQRWLTRALRDRTPSDDQNDSLLRSLIGRSADSKGSPELARLGMAGIVQDPHGFRGMLGSKGYLFVELPAGAEGTENNESSASFMRLSFSLEPGR